MTFMVACLRSHLLNRHPPYILHDPSPTAHPALLLEDRKRLLLLRTVHDKGRDGADKEAAVQTFDVVVAGLDPQGREGEPGLDVARMFGPINLLTVKCVCASRTHTLAVINGGST